MIIPSSSVSRGFRHAHANMHTRIISRHNLAEHIEIILLFPTEMYSTLADENISQVPKREKHFMIPITSVVISYRMKAGEIHMQPRRWL